MREFFGFGGYNRQPEGAYSWQHLAFVSGLMLLMVLLAVFLGKRNKNRDEKIKNKVLIWSAILIDGFEIMKLIIAVIKNGGDFSCLLIDLPLFLCSIQLITIPLAAFCKGRIREASLDFVMIFGILGGVLGTVGAAQNYGCYPVLSWDNVVSGITHTISGFASLYIILSGMASMKKQNLPLTLGILSGFCVAAYVVNQLIDYNYMFLTAGDGTPYDILFNLVGGHKVFYPVCVVLLFFVYILSYYGIFYLVTRKKVKEKV